MIRSMTGYARAVRQFPWGRLRWELRSVNHRYLDLSLRLPEDFRVLEPQIRERFDARMGRGKVDATLRFEATGEQAPQLELNAARLQQLTAACARIADVLEDSAPVQPAALLAMPGVLREQALEVSDYSGDVLALLDEALDDLNASRAREGERLAAVLRERSAAIVQALAAVEQRLPQVRSAWEDKLREALAELAQDADPGRLEQELVIAAQKRDVDEEIERLKSHLAELELALSLDEPVGRRLDFLIQEFNREANTLASKPQDAEVTKSAVEMKVLIEQMREQVQNIE